MIFEAEIVFARGPFGKPEADVVWRDYPMTGVLKTRNEFAVEERPGRIAVQQQHRIAFAFVDIVHAMAVDPHEPAFERKVFTNFRRQRGRRRVVGNRHHEWILSAGPE